MPNGGGRKAAPSAASSGFAKACSGEKRVPVAA